MVFHERPIFSFSSLAKKAQAAPPSLLRCLQSTPHQPINLPLSESMWRAFDLHSDGSTTDSKRFFRKMHRKLGRHLEQAQGLSKLDVERMQLVTTKDLRGLRDKVLLGRAYDTMRRRSELAGLRFEDLQLRNDGGDILLRKSKTDQEGRGIRIFFCPVTGNLLRVWIEQTGISNGPLLWGVYGFNHLNTQLTGGQIGRIFKKLASRAGLAESAVRHISGHQCGLVGSKTWSGRGQRSTKSCSRAAGQRWIPLCDILKWRDNRQFKGHLERSESSLFDFGLCKFIFVGEVCSGGIAKALIHIYRWFPAKQSACLGNIHLQ